VSHGADFMKATQDMGIAVGNIGLSFGPEADPKQVLKQAVAVVGEIALGTLEVVELDD
jgi:hypothetical protein